MPSTVLPPHRQFHCTIKQARSMVPHIKRRIKLVIHRRKPLSKPNHRLPCQRWSRMNQMPTLVRCQPMKQIIELGLVHCQSLLKQRRISFHWRWRRRPVNLRKRNPLPSKSPSNDLFFILTLVVFSVRPLQQTTPIDALSSSHPFNTVGNTSDSLGAASTRSMLPSTKMNLLKLKYAHISLSLSFW